MRHEHVVNPLGAPRQFLIIYAKEPISHKRISDDTDRIKSAVDFEIIGSKSATDAIKDFLFLFAGNKTHIVSLLEIPIVNIRPDGNPSFSMPPSHRTVPHSSFWTDLSNTSMHEHETGGTMDIPERKWLFSSLLKPKNPEMLEILKQNTFVPPGAGYQPNRSNSLNRNDPPKQYHVRPKAPPPPPNPGATPTFSAEEYLRSTAKRCDEHNEKMSVKPNIQLGFDANTTAKALLHLRKILGNLNQVDMAKIRSKQFNSQGRKRKMGVTKNKRKWYKTLECSLDKTVGIIPKLIDRIAIGPKRRSGDHQDDELR